jgi:hypothetical protein
VYDVPVIHDTNVPVIHDLFIYLYKAPPEVIFDDVVRLKGFATVRKDDKGTGIEGPGRGTIRWVSMPTGEIREELMEYDPPYMHFYQIDPEKSTSFESIRSNICKSLSSRPSNRF